MLKSVLSEGREDQLLNEFSVRKFAYLSLMGGLVFIMNDHDNFLNWIMIMNSIVPSWIMTLNSMFPSLRIIQYFSNWVGDFLFLS